RPDRPERAIQTGALLYLFPPGSGGKTVVNAVLALGIDSCPKPHPAFAWFWGRFGRNLAYFGGVHTCSLSLRIQTSLPTSSTAASAPKCSYPVSGPYRSMLSWYVRTHAAYSAASKEAGLLSYTSRTICFAFPAPHL